MGDTKRANRAPQIDNLPVACECNSLNSILQTALARLEVSLDVLPIISPSRAVSVGTIPTLRVTSSGSNEPLTWKYAYRVSDCCIVEW